MSIDESAGAAVEAACEKSLFASPEAVAAAVAYMDARVSLLSASIGLAERDPSYRPAFERWSRARRLEDAQPFDEDVHDSGNCAPRCAQGDER